MSAPSTLVLRDDDDERTIVDPRVPAVRPAPDPDDHRPNQPGRCWRMWLRNRWRPLLVVVAAAALCMSLLALVLHQRRLSDRLRQTIDAMQEAARALPLREATPAQSSNEDRASPRTGSRSRSTDLQSTDREQLELKAATFVIANDYRAALDSYLRLAAGSPDEPVFSDLVTILRAKLACRAKHGLDGPPCD